MTKLELFRKLMDKAKENGYKGPDYKFNIGQIINETNAYSVFFREDFAEAVFGKHGIGKGAMPYWIVMLRELAISKDKWKFLEKNVKFD